MKKIIKKNKKILFSVDAEIYSSWKCGSDNALIAKQFKTKTEIFETFSRWLLNANIDDLKKLKENAETGKALII